MCKPFSDIWPLQLFVNKALAFSQTSPFAACLRMAILPAATVFLFESSYPEVTLPWRLPPRRLNESTRSEWLRFAELICHRSFLNDTDHQVVFLGQQVLQKHSDRHRRRRAAVHQSDTIAQPCTGLMWRSQ